MMKTTLAGMAAVLAISATGVPLAKAQTAGPSSTTAPAGADMSQPSSQGSAVAPQPAAPPASTAPSAASPAAPAEKTADSGTGEAKKKLTKSDREFVMKAAQANLAEIADAQLAQQKASRDDVKQFAQKIIDDHTKAGDQLKQVVASDDVELPTEPSGADKNEAQTLGTASGASFDKAYIKSQLDAHRKAIKLFEKESKSGKDEGLKQFASDTLPVLKDHYKMARDLKSAKTPSAAPAQ